MTRPLWFHGGVRRRQGAAAVVAAIVAVGAVAGVTAHQSSQVQAVPAPQMPAPVERIAEVDADVEAVESVSPELEGETLTPSAEPSTQTFSLPDVPLFPTFHYWKARTCRGRWGMTRSPRSVSAMQASRATGRWPPR